MTVLNIPAQWRATIASLVADISIFIYVVEWKTMCIVRLIFKQPKYKTNYVINFAEQYLV